MRVRIRRFGGLSNYRTVNLGSLLAVFPPADFLHPRFANGRAFRPAFRRKRFGPFPGYPGSFTPTLLPEGQP